MAKVLIVDDRESNLLALENVLRQLDVEIIKASTGDEALRATLYHDFALAILDVQMPVMDGYELATLLRSDERTRNIPIIFLSAVYFEDPYIFKGYESGAVDFITKPFNPKVLLSKIGIFLELAEQKSELANKGAKLQTVVAELESKAEECRRTEEEILRMNGLLRGINTILREAINRETEEELAKTCLAVAEELTGSKFGFLGEIDESGLFHDIALSDPGWAACRMPVSNVAMLRHNFEVRGVWKRVLNEGISLIVNDTSYYPDKRELPAGHPSMRSFMATPLKNGDKTFGMIALGNKEHDYTQQDSLAMESIAVAFVEALARKRAEDQIRRAHDSLEEIVYSRTAELKSEIEERLRVEEQIRLDESRFAALYNLTQMAEATDREIIDFVLEEQLKITRSKAGAIDFPDEAETGYAAELKNVTNFRGIGNDSMRLMLNGSGIGVRAIRERRPVVINDFNGPHDAGESCPDKRRLARVMSVPVFDGNAIVAVAVVGNKEEDYTDSDARQLSLLLDGMCKLLKQRRAEENRKIYTTKLEQSNRELEDFAFVVSHDLQEPLRKIQTFSDRLSKTNFDERTLDYLLRMRKSAARMQELLLDLLRYSRVTSRPEPFTPIDLTEAAQEAVTDLRLLCEESGGTVEIGDLPTVAADQVQMRQLFQNLIGNSLKYHGESRPHVRIYNDTECMNEGVRILVEDNGIGFDERFLDRIFKPFQRLHGKNSIYPGTGMGLAICRRIVEHHGGSITARSQPGEGTTFIINLPAEIPGRESGN